MTTPELRLIDAGVHLDITALAAGASYCIEDDANAARPFPKNGQANTIEVLAR
jgi:hypothetical protein